MATTTTTKTSSKAAPTVATSTYARNTKDSLKSTWRDDRSQWGFFHYLYQILDLYPQRKGVQVPIHEKTDKIPNVQTWQAHRWILIHAIVPILLHQAYISYYGRNIGAIAAFVYYTLCFKLIGIHQLNVMRRIGEITGYLDGDKHERDDIPDVGVRHILVSLLSTITFREMIAAILAYRVGVTPTDVNWLYLPVEVSLYGIVLDFWFYWYHRFMHQFDSLWKYHRTHHLTKHPNALMTLYADTEQEIFDIVGIPLLTYLTLKYGFGLPMSFYEWWFCYQYVVFSELAGHSGLRIHIETPNPMMPVLRHFNCELVIEDHDLHHRKGWKKSHNYGKQTRLWDRIFGTCADRIEDLPENVDYENEVEWPMF